MSSTESVSMGRDTTAADAVVDFDAFVAARSSRMLTMAYLLTRDHGRAEDLLQTALAKTWLAWPRVDNPDAYLRRTMVNTYSSWWQRRWRDERPSDDLPDQPYGDEHAGLHTLWAAIGRLPRGQRSVLVLRYYEDLTEAETARVLGCSVGTVKSQCAKGLAKLRLDSALTDDEMA
jgi:RNA polymerase sigma-70 factor (sigma-E family)